MYEFSYSITIQADINECFKCLTNLPKLFALNPQWDVKSLDKVESIKNGSIFTLKVKYDRSDEDKDITATIEEFVDPNLFTLNLISDNTRKITFRLSQVEDKTTIEYKEIRDCDFCLEDKRELIYWLRSLGNYHLICKNKTIRGKSWRWFVDRVWLKMSPAGRRMVFMIVLFEALTLLLLIVFLIVKSFFN